MNYQNSVIKIAYILTSSLIIFSAYNIILALLFRLFSSSSTLNTLYVLPNLIESLLITIFFVSIYSWFELKKINKKNK